MSKGPKHPQESEFQQRLQWELEPELQLQREELMGELMGHEAARGWLQSQESYGRKKVELEMQERRLSAMKRFEVVQSNLDPDTGTFAW
eukprot:CAMPEP_0174300726 /NCGR_PEP_ID=MMETSP0809-20121228/58631_1 /TAXON_ID=73025 ORGANISM="Eutreptiella gymnastica-like, Strain CCMP1594" /NCGR_SAMPLE_ID=MMETSP0809 /ASSEMBLY_ACC=CAM_ASM_000658 /LENGTH=88 /DNA_ID=CAMNT_0015406355 /DNA_START=42 /DNA_END=305 /DNA_ORIENTATION=+